MSRTIEAETRAKLQRWCVWGSDDKSRCRIEVEKSGCWANPSNLRSKAGSSLKPSLIYTLLYTRGCVCACACTCGGAGFAIETAHPKSQFPTITCIYFVLTL